MKIPTLWKSVFLGGIAMPLCIAMPADVPLSERWFSTGTSWEMTVFLAVAGLAVIIKFLAMCSCGEKPQKEESSPPDTDENQPVMLISQQPALEGTDSTAVQNPPFAATQKGQPYENGTTVQAPPSPTKDAASGGAASPMSRSGTIDRQLPAIPPGMAPVGSRGLIDYDDDYDTIRDGRKEEDHNGTYATVKEKGGRIPAMEDAEGDYADVPDMGPRTMPTCNNFGDYAAVDNTARRNSSGKTGASRKVLVVQATVVAPERMAPRAESEDISDAEYAVVDLKESKMASGNKESAEPYDSVKVAEEQGPVAKVTKKHHGYAKIDDVRGDVPGPSGLGSSVNGPDGADTEEVDQGQGFPPIRSPQTPPPRSPSHSAGSPTHQQRSLPEINESAMGAVGGTAATEPILDVSHPAGGPAGPEQVLTEELGPVAQGSTKKEPRYSQVSARESLARVRARQQEEQATSVNGGPQVYQMVDEDSPQDEEDHNGLYESVDYQAVETNPERTSYDNARQTANTLPPRRGRVYEEIHETDGTDQPEDAEASIEPYAVVQPLNRRQTAPSRMAGRNDSSGSNFSELYATVDKYRKETQGMSAENNVDDFNDLYAKVDKKKKNGPRKVQSFDDNGSEQDIESLISDGMYAEVKKPRSGSEGQRSTNSSTLGARGNDYDDSYQSIDDLKVTQNIHKRAKEVGMVHIDDVQTMPLVWTKPEHTYASVDSELEQGESNVDRGQGCTPNRGHTAKTGEPHHEVQHNYEVVDKKQPKKGKKEKKKNKGKEDKKSGNGKSSSSKESPTHLDSRQLKLLTDRHVKETNL